MKKVLQFSYSIIAYLIGFASLLLWILSVSDLIPEVSIDGVTKTSFTIALLKNIGLVCLFAIPHSVMARKPFKDFINNEVDFTGEYPKEKNPPKVKYSPTTIVGGVGGKIIK